MVVDPEEFLVVQRLDPIGDRVMGQLPTLFHEIGKVLLNRFVVVFPEGAGVGIAHKSGCSALVRTQAASQFVSSLEKDLYARAGSLSHPLPWSQHTTKYLSAG